MSDALVQCSSDGSDMVGCKEPANWMLFPYENANERAPFCDKDAKALDELFPFANPDGFQMTIRQAHLWIAQSRLCVCPHPDSNCTQPASVVINSIISGTPEVIAICIDCISCGNGFLEGFQEVINGMYLEPTLKG